MDDTFWGSIIMASYNTIGHIVRRRVPTGPGTYSEWAGTWDDVNDSDLDDTTAVNTSTVETRQTFTAPALADPSTGNVIKTIAVAARSRNDGGEIPTNLRAMLRQDGADILAPYDMAVSGGFQASVTCFDRDPSTGQLWTIARANAEFGLKATP